jgi:hypothetical protein
MKRDSIPPIALISMIAGCFAWLAIAYSITRSSDNRATGFLLLTSFLCLIAAIFIHIRSSVLSLFFAGLSEGILILTGWFFQFTPNIYWGVLGILTAITLLLSNFGRNDENEWEDKNIVRTHATLKEPVRIEFSYFGDSVQAAGGEGQSLKPYWMDEDANSLRDKEDEAYAKQLLELFAEADEQFEKNRVEFKRIQLALHQIGKTLYENGGDERMERVAFIVRALGGKIYDCEFFWDGIGSWKFKK